MRTLLLTALAILMVTANRSLVQSFQIGDQPSYVGLQECPKPAQFAIAEKEFPAQLIHSCTSESLDIDGEKGWLVKVEYGQAQDCPAGCFYVAFVGVVQDHPRRVNELPGPRTSDISGLIAQKLWPDSAGKQDLSCDPPGLEDVLDFTIVRFQGALAWKIYFRRPFRCSWVEVKGGVHRTLETTGAVFAYLKSGQTVLNLEGLKTYRKISP